MCSEFKAMNLSLKDDAQQADLSCSSLRVRGKFEFERFPDPDLSSDAPMPICSARSGPPHRIRQTLSDASPPSGVRATLLHLGYSIHVRAEISLQDRNRRTRFRRFWLLVAFVTSVRGAKKDSARPMCALPRISWQAL